MSRITKVEYDEYIVNDSEFLEQDILKLAKLVIKMKMDEEIFVKVLSEDSNINSRMKEIKKKCEKKYKYGFRVKPLFLEEEKVFQMLYGDNLETLRIKLNYFGPTHFPLRMASKASHKIIIKECREKARLQGKIAVVIYHGTYYDFLQFPCEDCGLVDFNSEGIKIY